MLVVMFQNLDGKIYWGKGKIIVVFEKKLDYQVKYLFQDKEFFKQYLYYLLLKYLCKNLIL